MDKKGNCWRSNSSLINHPITWSSSTNYLMQCRHITWSSELSARLQELKLCRSRWRVVAQAAAAKSPTLSRPSTQRMLWWHLCRRGMQKVTRRKQLVDEIHASLRPTTYFNNSKFKVPSCAFGFYTWVSSSFANGMLLSWCIHVDEMVTCDLRAPRVVNWSPGCCTLAHFP